MTDLKSVLQWGNGSRFPGGGWVSGELAAAVHDEAVGEIVRRYGDRYAIAGNDFDMEASESSADARKKRVPLVALYAEVPASESLYHFSLNLNEIVACHSTPFCRVSTMRRRCVKRSETARLVYQRN